MTRPRILGLDLGTTNTVVAETRGVAPSDVQIVQMPQLVGSGEVGARALFPSVLFLPPEGETRGDPFGDAPWVLGEYARARGQTAPRRAITSAKSWLSHGAVDRLGPILPWGADAADTSLTRVSPVEASRRLLEHVARSTAIRSSDRVVLTVPASFDEVARELTLRAAHEAGLAVRLLEEPVAAFYDFLASSGPDALRALMTPASPDVVVLVCDVGGGTTDLTLVRVTEKHGELHYERVAVGRHLLLGGDNMDLALAHALEPALKEPPERLDPALFAELVLACRAGKERLLGADAPDRVPIRLLSRGSQLVGSTLAATLERARVLELVLDGFFPVVDAAAPPARPRTGLVGFGLPYETDPAITRHVAAFLERHRASGPPRAVLLNGGVFHSADVQGRLLDTLAALTGAPVFELPATDPDLAVARGAVHFGLALDGQGPRIGGGSARGFYVGLAGAGGERRAVCVVPRGARESERHVVRVPGLSLVVGQPVRFDLFASNEAAHAPGEVVPVAPAFDALPSMSAAFSGEHGPADTRVPVHLEGELTAVGTLDVACVEETAETAPRRYRLAFDVRAREATRSSLPPPSRSSESKRAAAVALVERAFGRDSPPDPGDAKKLLRELERVLGERAAWDTETARALFDALVPLSRARKRSADHERTFWLLAGFTGRPGYGHPTDDRRVGRIVPLWNELVTFAPEDRVWQQFFIAWRRLAGGLGEPAQTAIRDLVDPFLSTDPVKPKKRKGLKPLAQDEMLELAASLERVPAGRRADLGRWILERTWTDRDPRLWAALARVGSRVPVYASAHFVVPTQAASTFVDHLLREKWNEVPTAARAAVQLARVTGDRTRDLPESLRKEVARKLVASGSPEAWVRAVTELVPLESSDRAEFFGDSLPVGLVLSE